jgi:hypothetical protein
VSSPECGHLTAELLFHYLHPLWATTLITIFSQGGLLNDARLLLLLWVYQKYFPLQNNIPDPEKLDLLFVGL